MGETGERLELAVLPAAFRVSSHEVAAELPPSQRRQVEELPQLASMVKRPDPNFRWALGQQLFAERVQPPGLLVREEAE
jgi:hypothetical protein